jgi:hypothetical protein
MFNVLSSDAGSPSGTPPALAPCILSPTPPRSYATEKILLNGITCDSAFYLFLYSLFIFLLFSSVFLFSSISATIFNP